MVQNKSSAAPTSVEKPFVMRDARPTEIRATVAYVKPAGPKEFYWKVRLTNLTGRRRYMECSTTFVNPKGQEVAWASEVNTSIEARFSLTPGGITRVDFGHSKSVEAHVFCMIDR